MFGLRIGGMGRVGSALTLTQQAINILRRPGLESHVYMPGVGWVNGFTLSNFIMEDGTQAASVDTQMGYVGDAVSSGFGSDLVTNGGFGTDTGWTKGTGWTISGGAATHASGSTSELSQSITVAAGRAYQIEYTVSGYSDSGTGGISPRFNGGTVSAGSLLTGNGTKTQVLVAVTGNNVLAFSVSSTVTCSIDNVTVRELVGAIPARQATTANKPILRRGAVNRLLNSATLSTQSVAVTAQPYTLHFAGTGTVTLSGASTAGPLVGTDSSNRVSLTFTPTAGSLTLTVSGSVTSAMLQTGSVATDYVPTTTAAASSPTGPFWAEFDGTDFLSLAAVPFQQADDHVVIAGASVQALTGVRVIYSQRNSAATQALCAYIRVNAAGELAALYRDDSGTPTVTVVGGTVTAGETFVATARRTSGVRTVRKNGVAGASNSTVFGTTTLNTSVIGASTTTTTADFMLGGIYPVIVIKGTVTDAELATLEKFVAAASGVTL